jgi:oligoendopeptidase F
VTVARGTALADMTYTTYDDTAFYAAIDRLCALAQDESTDNTDRLCQLYDDLYDQILYMDTLNTLAYLSYCQDVTDDTWYDRYSESSTQLIACADALCSACCQVTQSAYADAFAAHVGDNAFTAFQDYAAVTQREQELYDQETALENQYEQLLAQGDISYAYEGEVWTTDTFYGYQGDALAARDYDAYLEVYDGLQQAAAELLAPVYAQLVTIRRQLADLAGYDSYVDYAYTEIYGRDYTPDDAQALCDAVKPLAQAYYENYYYSDLWYATDTIEPTMDSDTLVQVLGTYVTELDASLAQPWQYMESLGLYDLGTGDSRYDGAYTTDLSMYQSPIIFATLSGTVQDFLTLSHEFGHFCNAYVDPMPNLLTTTDNYDLLEIHSNGLQALLTGWYDEIFSQGADVAEFVNLAGLVENVVDGCVQDEFQRRVYATDEALTAETINRIYTQVCAEYGLYAPLSWDSTWAYIPHNFESPLYYISYATSALAALQLWDTAQTDPQAAADTYLALLQRGAHDLGYFQVLEENGLLLFNQEGAVDAICQPVFNRLETLILQSENSYY